MSLKDLFGTPIVKSPFVSSGGLVEDGQLVYFPSTTKVHAGMTRAMIERGTSLVIVVPADRPSHLHLLATEGLFTNTDRDRDAVFVLSSNTEVRGRFRELAPKSSLPPHDKAPYAREEAPIANVTTDGSLATVTKNLNYPEKPPRFLFSYTSARLPSDEVGQRVRCVIYDDSVKFHPDRLRALRQWRARNDIPAIVYLTSNPAGGLVDNLLERVWVWTWPRELFRESVSADTDSLSEWSSETDLAETTRRSLDIIHRERNRSSGVAYEIHTCGDGTIEDLLTRANARRAKFEHLVSKLDSKVLQEAKPLVRYALRDFQELLSPIDLATFHARRSSIPSRLAGLDRFQSQIDSDPEASPAGGAYRDVLSVLQDLESEWDDAPAEHKKTGELVSLLYAVLDRDESVTVVAPSENQEQAVTAYLQSEHTQLYRDLGEDLLVRDSRSVRSSPSTDTAILYGSLRWGDRDLLRTDVASEVIVLAYPIEFPLLSTQVRDLEDALESITECRFWDVVTKLTQRVCDDDARASVERIDLEVPDEAEHTTSALGDEISIEQPEDTDLGDLVRTYQPDYDSASDEIDPTELSTTESRATDDDRDSSPSRSGRTETGCLDVHFVDGHALYLRPDDSVHIVMEGHNNVLKKSARALSVGDIIAHLEDTNAMREELYDLIRNRGDVGLYYYANLWRVSLEAALEETSDDVTDFIEKMNDQGLSMSDHTYESWYEFEVQRTRSKESLWAIADAYELETVKENFTRVWDAVQDMETIYSRLKSAVREAALQSSAGAIDDVLLSENPDIRLSDFDIDRYLHRLEINSIEDDVEAPRSQLGWLREL